MSSKRNSFAVRGARIRQCTWCTIIAMVAATLAATRSTARAGVDAEEHAALLNAVQRVADSVVQIQAIGGLDQVEGQQIASGPTTGLIVASEGYVVASAFGFAQGPSSILVRLPSGRRVAAELVGRDLNRMLVLLKVDAEEPLPVPEPTPLDEIKPGYAAAALGRTFREDQPNITTGIVSQLGRMHNRALQTDASISTANYGGPLVDLQGRVLGVLVPMAPQSSSLGEANEVAGVEFYDSGIGFAVPLEHVLAVLPRWIREKELRRGLLGIGMTAGSPHASPAEITSIWPGSPAAAAGWRVGDRIVAVDGTSVATQTQLRFQVVPHYAGDVLNVTLERPRAADAQLESAKQTEDNPSARADQGARDRVETQITLAAKLEAYRHAFLGILPERTAPTSAADAKEGAAGVTVRGVWPQSPAEAAGIQAGDQLSRLDGTAVANAEALAALLKTKNVGEKVAVQILRQGAAIDVEGQLTAMPSEVISKTFASRPPQDGQKQEGQPQERQPQERQPKHGSEWEKGELRIPDWAHGAEYYKPSDMTGQVGLLVWLGPSNDKDREALVTALQGPFRAMRLALLLPSATESGPDPVWSRDDLAALNRLLEMAMGQLKVDPRRVAVGGHRRGGQGAYEFGFRARRMISGIFSIAAPLPRTLQLPENVPSSRLQILALAEQDSPFSLLVRNDVAKMAAAGYPAVWMPATAQSDGVVFYRNAEAIATTLRWLDSLDAL